MFEILAERGGYVFPLFYVLLPNKTQRTYTRLFGLIKGLRPTMIPELVYMDFEMALINSVRSSWPTAEIQGCLFHFHQSIMRRIAQEGILNFYFVNFKYLLRIKACL